MRANAKAFFVRVIQEYNCGDIKYLLAHSAGLAGPLLAVTVNGIDLLGGMLYGFGCGSRARSVRLMEEHMHMTPAVGETIYACVRCGVAHEGTPKVRFKFGIFPARPACGKIVFKDPADHSLALNVTELAYAYLNVVDEIAKDIGEHPLHVPQPSRSDEGNFERAYQNIRDDVELLQNTGGRTPPPLSSSTGVWVPHQ